MCVMGDSLQAKVGGCLGVDTLRLVFAPSSLAKVSSSDTARDDRRLMVSQTHRLMSLFT